MALSLSRRVFVLPAVRATPAMAIGAEVLFVVGLVALAGYVRWPNLLLSPQFPSVGETVLRALAVADGQAFYLSDSAPYLGAPFLYLLAAVYKLAGPSVVVTQLVAWTIGTLTIVPTYLLGREVGGRFAGLVAGALLATSGAHTVISSHVALSHSLTPLVATVTLWLLARAVRQAGDRSLLGPDGRDASMSRRWGPAAMARGGRMLALAGLGAGLSLQTHPTVFPLLAGAGLGAVALRPGWLRTRWPAVALACLVLGYGTLLAHHVGSRFEVVGDIEGKQARYLDADQDAGESAERGVYANNLQQLGLSVVRLTSGAILTREDARDYLTDGWVLIYAVLAVAGFLAGLRRGGGWLAVGAVMMILLPPVLSGKYEPILDGRYLMPLVPVLFVGIGLAFAELGRMLAGRGRSSAADVGVPGGPGQSGRGSVAWTVGRSVALAGLVIGALVLVARPVTHLEEFYEETQEDGFSNALYLRTLDQVKTARAGNEAVILDERLQQVKSLGGGKAGTNFHWLLAVSRIPVEPLSEPADPQLLDGRLAILQRATAERLAGQLTLAPVDGRRTNGRDPQSYRAYRLWLRSDPTASPRL